MMLILDEITVVAVISYIVYWLQCQLFNYIFFDIKTQHKFADVLIGILYAFLLVNKVISEDAVISSIFIFFNLMLTLNSSFKGKIICTLKIIFFTNSCWYAIQALLSMIIQVNIASMSDFEWLMGSSIFLVLLLIIAVCKKYRLMKLHIKVTQGILKVWIYCAMVIMGISIPLTIGGLSYAVGYVNNSKFYKFTNVTSMFSFSSLVFLVLFIFYMNDINKKMKKNLEVERLLTETQKNYYEAMLKKEEATRRFRHDVINHLICLQGLAEKEDKRMVVDYIEQLQKQVVSIQQTCYTVGNEVIDATLNGLLPQLKDAEVIVKGNCTESIAMSHVELCTIVANLLQNAVEELECLDIDEKYLKVNAVQGKQYMKLEIINCSAEKAIDKKSNLPISSKEDKKNHGIGLKNVKETIEKNHGTFSWECRDGEFRVTIALPINKGKK